MGAVALPSQVLRCVTSNHALRLGQPINIDINRILSVPKQLGKRPVKFLCLLHQFCPEQLRLLPPSPELAPAPVLTLVAALLARPLWLRAALEAPFLPAVPSLPTQVVLLQPAPVLADLREGLRPRPAGPARRCPSPLCSTVWRRPGRPGPGRPGRHGLDGASIRRTERTKWLLQLVQAPWEMSLIPPHRMSAGPRLGMIGLHPCRFGLDVALEGAFMRGALRKSNSAEQMQGSFSEI